MQDYTSQNEPEKSLEQIVRNAFYDLIFDKARNRIYFTIHGFWKNKDIVPQFIDDWKKAITLTQSGFTILTDMRTMITHPQELRELHMAAQKLVIDAGVKQVANVLPTDRIANLQTSGFTTGTTLPYHNFEHYDEAEVWLNNFPLASTG